MASSIGRRGRRRAPRPEAGPTGTGGSDRAVGELRLALALTLASTLAWGVAHLWAGRRLTGRLLLGLYVTLLALLALTLLTVDQESAASFAADPDMLRVLVAGLLLLGAVWVAVVVRSYQLVMPGSLSVFARTAGAAAVAVVCFAVAVPVAYGAHSAFVARDLITSIFQTADANGQKVDADDPFKGKPRLNVLLLGGDAASNRVGVRTDSMTVASIDTRTGDTVLLSLPRNLERVPMPAGPARNRFPYGFTGDGSGTPGLLNEVYQYAEDHPDVVPGVPKDRRGPSLLSRTISGTLGIDVHYFALVDMFGFADLIDAMGGVRMRIDQPIPYGMHGGVLQPGNRKLTGKEALWYGRSRTLSDDYSRMGRQKCLLRAIATQADPKRVLLAFDQLVTAAKRTLSTDIPQEMLNGLISLSGKVRSGARIDSLQFVPPLISTGNPDFARIRQLTARALQPRPARSAAPSSSPPPSTPPVGATQPASPSPDGARPLSLADSCPS